MAPATTFLLASVLKPLDDTRMFEKVGRTLAQRPGAVVHVAGRHAAPPAGAPPNLHTHALLRGGRLSWARVAAQGRYWQLLRRLHPDLVVVHAPELLPLTLLWQALGGGRRFLYDVRENYALNIRTQAVYPRGLRGLLAGAVRALETWAAGRAAAVLLAERSYADELPFAEPARTLILENKYQPQPGETLPALAPPLPAFGEPLRLLFSGTVSELNGVFEAVRFVQHLRRQWPAAQLTIIGVCQQPRVLARLQDLVLADAGITLIGGAELVPHARIVAEIGRSHVGLLPYREHPSSWRCVPTKLYEYLAHGLPVLVPPNPLWLTTVQQHRAGAAVDFAAPGPDAAAALAALRAQAAYPAGPPAEALWQSEAAKLNRLLDSLQ